MQHNYMKKVMVFGTFDILHAGHIHVFTEAKKVGDHLIVVVARDERVTTLKGKAPLHTEQERMTLLHHIRLIDTVVLGDVHDVYKVIDEYTPDIIALGYDQEHFTDNLAAYISVHHLSTTIIRLTPYKPEKHKSTVIKEQLLKLV